MNANKVLKRVLATAAVAALSLGALSGCAKETKQATGSGEAKPVEVKETGIERLQNGFSGEVPAELKDQLAAKMEEVNSGLDSLRQHVEMQVSNPGGAIDVKSEGHGQLRPKLAFETHSDSFSFGAQQTVYIRIFADTSNPTTEQLETYQSRDGKAWDRLPKELSGRGAGLVPDTNTSVFFHADAFKNAKLSVSDGAIVAEFDTNSVTEELKKTYQLDKLGDGPNSINLDKVIAKYDLKTLYCTAVEMSAKITTEVGNGSFNMKMTISDHNKVPPVEKPQLP